MIKHAAVVASLLLSLAECNGGGGSVAKSCDIRVNVHPRYVPPKDGNGRGMIEAAVKAWCDSPPSAHQLYVRLEIEKEGGKRWEEIAQSDPYPVRKIPTKEGIIVRVSALCVDGIFRVYARAEGRGPDAKGNDRVWRPFTLPEDEMMARSIKCPPIKS